MDADVYVRWLYRQSPKAKLIHALEAIEPEEETVLFELACGADQSRPEVIRHRTADEHARYASNPLMLDVGYAVMRDWEHDSAQRARRLS